MHCFYGVAVSSFRYDEVVPQVSSLYLSAMIGLNRLSLIVGLTKPVADQEVLRVVPEGYVDRKVGDNSEHCSLIFILRRLISVEGVMGDRARYAMHTFTCNSFKFFITRK